jgi:hypothetical protein
MHLRLVALAHNLLLGIVIATLGGIVARSVNVVVIALFCLLVSAALAIALMLSGGRGTRGQHPR